MKISIELAVKKIRNGEVVAVPTETVYGLAASLEHPKAIQAIFDLKGRPAKNPLIIHVNAPEDITSFLITPVEISPFISFWPGPLTLVLPVQLQRVPEKARAGLPTAAFRIPAHPLARALIKQTGPLVMPSANLSGKPSATSFTHVEEDFGSLFPVIDGGICQNGLESTVLVQQDNQWVIIRQGAISQEQFKEVLGYLPQIESGNRKEPLCPGQLYRHYAPKAHLHLSDEFPPGSVVLGFKESSYPASCQVLFLGSLNAPYTIAENLYNVLRQLDRLNIESAFVDMRFAKIGILATVAERLERAALKK